MALLDRPGVILALLTVVAVALLMWNLARKAPKQAAGSAPETKPEARTGPAASAEGDDLLLKFVTNESGERLGETVATDDDHTILKVKDGFVGVPTAKVKQVAGGLQLDFGIDWDEAKRVGEAWREKSTKVISYAESELPKDEA